MSSSLRGKRETEPRLVSGEEPVAVPISAHPTDETPTVISKTHPLVEPPTGSSKEKIVDLGRKHATPESIVASLRGRRLAHYELIEPIGVGGMAAVIRARDTQLDRFVALKILPPEMAVERENVERFHQEAKAAAKLDHENIARVFYCGEDQGLHFIAFEFVEGKNLRIMLDQRGRLPVAEAVRYILQVAVGLEHAGSRGVVHRDVKPSNIIITPAGRAKLVDMGLARNMERKGERDLTQSGVTLGTFDYISPEQALEPREADMRSDIYSLGCTFYHLLTGSPPVPEGTPAKKLQHHQNSAPIDPRSIDPTIPDEIVVILAKMMEKNPKDRYQRPIHLVHHLMQVAQKVGAADDVPEGLLLVDAPLPAEPRGRPLLFIGLALASLVVVTLLATFMADPPRNPVLRPSEGDSGKGSIASWKKEIQPQVKPEGPAPSDHPAVLKDAKDFRAFLGDSSSDIAATLTIDETIDLANLPVLFKGGADQKLLLQSDDPDGEHAKVRFQYRSGGTQPGMVLEGGKEIVFKRIRFQLDSAGTPEKAVAAITIRGAQNVRFEQCIFSQNVPKFPGEKKVRLASVLIDAPPTGAESARTPIVYLNECYFDGGNTGGQVAVAVNGPAVVNVRNCAFKPHSAFFHLRKKSSLEQTILNLQNCAGFVVFGPAFRFDDDAGGRIQLGSSVFSRPNGLVEDGSEPNLISLGEGATFQYFGDHNLYHNLNAFVGKNIYGEDFQKFLAARRSKDQNARYLDRADALQRSPWQQSEPLNYTGPGDFAFQLKPEYHDARFGLQKSWLGRMNSPPAALVKVGPSPAPKNKIVDADDEMGTPGVFPNVASALKAAKDGDVILVRNTESSRDVVVSPVELEPGISVLLKPDDDYQPRLVLNKKFRDKETSIFKVREGKLEIEGMEIVLDPGEDAEVTQSIVQIGQGHCVFRRCVFTLRATKREQLCVASSIDLDRMMKSEMVSTPGARVDFHECFVRGKGDLVSLNGCRLLNVELKNSLVALDGSLLEIEAGNKTMPMTQGVHWKMERSSIFTTDSLFALRARVGKMLTETNATVEGCVLASLALDPAMPVVTLDREFEIANFVKWKGEQNFYANFDRLRDWKDQYPEQRSDYSKLALPRLTEKNLHSLWEAVPDWFKAGDAAEERLLQGFGQPGDSEKRMMIPLAESEDP